MVVCNKSVRLCLQLVVTTHYTQSFQCVGRPGMIVPCRAQGLTRILDICAEDWTGSSRMWVCNGECRVAVEALQEVSTLSTQCTQC